MSVSISTSISISSHVYLVVCGVWCVVVCVVRGDRCASCGVRWCVVVGGGGGVPPTFTEINLVETCCGCCSEWLFILKRIIIVRGADLSEFFR